MKYLKIIFLLIVFHSYNLIAQKSSNQIEQVILGEWLISKSKFISSENGKLTEIACNACPTVKFTKDGNAVVILLTGEKEMYTWKIKNNKISFKNTGFTN